MKVTHETINVISDDEARQKSPAQEVKHMTEGNELTWEAAIASGGKFVKFEEGKKKRLTLKNCRLEKNPPDAKVAAGEISFKADVIKEDGIAVEKLLEVNSNRLKERLRPLFPHAVGNKEPEKETTVTITAIGDGYKRQYIVDVEAQ